MFGLLERSDGKPLGLQDGGVSEVHLALIAHVRKSRQTYHIRDLGKDLRVKKQQNKTKKLKVSVSYTLSAKVKQVPLLVNIFSFAY